MNLLQLMHAAFQRVPDRLRGWLYLSVVLVLLGYVVVTGIRSGLGLEQVVALVTSIVVQLANSNRPTVKAKSRSRTGRVDFRIDARDDASETFRRISRHNNLED